VSEESNKEICIITEMVSLINPLLIKSKDIHYFIELKDEAVTVSDSADVETSKEQTSIRRNEQNAIIRRWYQTIYKVYKVYEYTGNEINNSVIAKLYTDTNNDFEMELTTPTDFTKDPLLIKLQDDFMKVLFRVKDIHEKGCGDTIKLKPKEKPPFKPTSKEYQVDVDFFKRQFYKKKPDGTFEIDNNGQKIPINTRDPPFYHVQSKMNKKGINGFFAHMFDSFNDAEMSMTFLKDDLKEDRVKATRRTVKVISDDDAKAIEAQKTAERNKITQKYDSQMKSLVAKREKELNQRVPNNSETRKEDVAVSPEKKEKEDEEEEEADEADEEEEKEKKY
jgi:hypothetical protein